jgi:hypothetical protein
LGVSLFWFAEATHTEARQGLRAADLHGTCTNSLLIWANKIAILRQRPQGVEAKIFENLAASN